MIDRLPDVWCTPDTKTTLRYIFNTFDTQTAFAAFKDLLSLCILYLEGGFYFDTTIDVDPRPGVVTQKLTDEATVGTVRAMARYLDQGSKPVFLEATPRAIIGREGTAIEGVPHVEVSAMYAPAGSPFVRRMIESYVARCCAVRIDTNTPLAFVNNRLVLDKAGSFRNDVIGRLAVFSVAEGLLAQANGSPRDVRAFCWGAVDTKPETTPADKMPPARLQTRDPQYIPQLGLTKRSGQTWVKPA
jgi:hypothetical protein